MTPLFFPIEFLNREIDFKLVLAAALLDGHRRRIYLGVADALWSAIDHCEKGIYIGKDVFRPYFTDEDRSYRRLKRKGHRLLHLDEEGAVYMGGAPEWEEQLLRRLDPLRIRDDDVLCTWGRFQRDVYRRALGSGGPRVVATGHPRLDLAKPEYQSVFDDEVARIRRSHGDFVLIVGNFPRVNHALGAPYIFSPFYNYRPDDERVRLSFVGRWAHFSTVFVQMVRVAHLLSTMPGLRVVVRPHPSEDAKFYQACFRDLANVSVESSGAALPWLKAARVVVHNGCTTAIEASLAGTPVVTFRPVQDPRFDKQLPNAFGAQVRSDEELLEAVRRAFVEPAVVQSERDPIADELISNFSGSAVRAIADLVTDLEDRGAIDRARHVARYARREAVVEATKDVPRRLLPSRRAMRARVKKKFPGFTAEDLAGRVDRVNRLGGRPIRIVHLSSRLVVIEGAS